MDHGQLNQVLSGVLGAIPAAILLAAMFGFGLLFLLFGWRIYRVALVVLCVLLGAGIGAVLSLLLGIPALILALPLGILAGVFAFFLEKVGAFLVGGLCGLLLVAPFAVFSWVQHLDILLYAGAVLAFVLFGALVVWLWRPLIILCLSLIGAGFIISGLVTILDRFGPASEPSLGARHPYLTAVAIILVALYGVYFQGRRLEEEKPAEPETKEGQ